MIEGKINLAGHHVAIQDEMIMVYVPGGEGNSEPLTAETIQKLRFLLQLGIEHYNAQEASSDDQ